MINCSCVFVVVWLVLFCVSSSHVLGWFVCLFYLIFYVPVNNFLVVSGQVLVG